MRQEDFQAFLRHLREHYPGRPLWLLLDRAPCHEAVKSQRLAARLGVGLLWLPKQCPELNAMDQLWKELKRLIAANRQFRPSTRRPDYAEQWFLGLDGPASPPQGRRLSRRLLAQGFLGKLLATYLCHVVLRHAGGRVAHAAPTAS